MKYAVLICGHMRTYQKTYDSLYNNVLEPHTPDVFIATWETMGTWRPEVNAEGKSAKYHGTVNLEDTLIDIVDIKAKYNPKVCEVYEYSQVKYEIESMAAPVYAWRDTLPKLYHTYRINSYIAQYLIRWRAFDLTKNSEYDAVILTRPDVNVGKIPNNSLDNLSNKVYIPYSSSLKDGWMQEILFLSNKKNIEIIASVYPNYSIIFREAERQNIPQFFMEPHNLLWHRLVKENNIEIEDTFFGEIIR